MTSSMSSDSQSQADAKKPKIYNTLDSTEMDHEVPSIEELEAQRNIMSRNQDIHLWNQSVSTSDDIKEPDYGYHDGVLRKVKRPKRRSSTTDIRHNAHKVDEPKKVSFVHEEPESEHDLANSILEYKNSSLAVSGKHDMGEFLYLYDQKLSNAVIAKPSRISTPATRSAIARSLIIRLRYGIGNRKRVAAILKLRDKPRISDGIPSQTRMESFQDWSPASPRSFTSNLNNAKKARINPGTFDNENWVSPGVTSSAVMMRFEKNARKLETASVAATDASSHRSISSDEEETEEEKDGNENSFPESPGGDEDLLGIGGFAIKCLCNSTEATTNMIMCNMCGKWQHTECYYPDNKKPVEMQIQSHRAYSAQLLRNQMAQMRMAQQKKDQNQQASKAMQSHRASKEMQSHQAYSAQLLRNQMAQMNMAQNKQDQNQQDTIKSTKQKHFCIDCVTNVDRSSDLDYFNAYIEGLNTTRPELPVNNSISGEALTEMEDTTNLHPLDLLTMTPLTGSFSQDTAPWREPTSNESHGALAEINSTVEKDTQSRNNQLPFTAEAYTDSGYASNATRALKSLETHATVDQIEGLPADYADTESRTVSGVEGGLQSKAQEDDLSSIYSDASSIPAFTKAGYIDGLADDLAQVMQPYQLNDEILQQIFETLPELLKAFALTFGHSSSRTMDRDIMVFIHRHRRQVVKTLENRLSMEEPESQNTDQADNMSLNEIMSLWHKSGECAQDGEPVDAEVNENLDFEGSDVTEPQEEDYGDDDYETDENGLPGIVIYRSFIRSAPAYNWFLDNLRRECTLAPPEPNLIGEIRNTILRALPSSPRFSRRKPAEIFNVSFVVDWDPVAFLREEHYTERPEDALERAITLTGSIASAQALTCSEYLRQTWPSTGEQILDLIKRLVSGETSASAALPNGSSLTVKCCPSQIQGSSSAVWVDAHGTAACVAEIGEQFAWLASALRSSPYPQQLAYSRPFIDSIQIGHVTYEETSPGVTYICKLGVELHQGQSGDSDTANGECWHGLFGRPVVVEGFPIPRRSKEDSPGLDIPLNIMAGLAQARRISSFDGKTLLKGFAAMLLPMKCTQGIVTWHLVHSKNGERISYLESNNFETVDVQIPELQKSRHILGWCPEMRSYAGAADACYLIKGSRLPRPSGRGALDNASLSLGHLVTGGTPFSEGRKDVRLRRNSYIARIKWISQKFVVLWDVEDKRGWLVNGTSALLHLVRASLVQDLLDSTFGALCVFSMKEFQEASRLHQTDAALEVLLNPHNLKAKIYPEEDDFIHFKAYVEDFSELLERMLDYQLRAVSQSPGKNIPRSLLEGWDFNDLATGRDPIYPREAFLTQEALSWIDFTRSVHAITLFGRSFGEVIQPAGECCSAWAKVPCGKSYLAASATDLYHIMESDGDPYSVPMRLTHDILWYTSKETPAQCQCNGEIDDEIHSDIAQVLLPFRLHRELSGTSSQLPPKSGAVIFGYNNNHRWFWGDNGDPSRTPNKTAGWVSQLHKGIRSSQSSDSGIGRSLGSSTSLTDSTSNQLDEGYPEPVHTMTSEPEDYPPSSLIHNKKNNHYADSNASSPLASQYKVGIVCALHIELMAVRASFDKTYKKVAIASEDTNYYALGSIEGHSVVAVCLPHGVYGTNAAADVASNMRRSFPGLKFCLLVGIGAGVPSPKNDIRLGDVVISTPKGGYSGVLPYDMIKTYDSGAFTLNGYLCPPPPHLMCAISELESDPSRSSTPLQKYLQQIEECKDQYKHPGVTHDQLFASNYVHNSDDSCDQCDSAYEIKRPPRLSTHPELHYGLIASGNQVMKSAQIRDRLSQEHNALCFEMEGAGIMNNFPCLIIRGICDYADSHKNKRWQNYAAATAAAYAKLLLSRLRTADGSGSEPSEPFSRKRTAIDDLGEEQPPAKWRSG